MPIYTFSTPARHPEDTEAVEAVKEHCERRRENFSALVTKLLKDYKEEHLDD